MTQPRQGMSLPHNIASPDIRSATLRAFDSASHTATLQFTGSLQQYVPAVPVARNIAAAEMTAGRKAAVAFFDPANPADAVVFAVWT